MDMLQQENENVLDQVYSLPLEGENLFKCVIVVGSKCKNPYTHNSFEKPRENVKKQRPEQENLKDRSVSLARYNSSVCSWSLIMKFDLDFCSL